MLVLLIILLHPQDLARLSPTQLQASSQPSSPFIREASRFGAGSAAQHDAIYGVSAWLDNLAPSQQPARVTLSSELTFDVSAASFQGSAIQSLRLRSLTYLTGQQGSIATMLPSTPDSSEGLSIHRAVVQIRDQSANIWSDVGASILDSAEYTLDAPWRDTPFAQRWSVATTPYGPHPGAIDRARTNTAAPFVDGHVQNGLMQLRLLFEVDIDGGAWDITHLIDECWIEVDAGMGVVRYPAISHNAYGDSTAQQVFLAIGSHGDAADMASAGDGRFSVDYWEDSTWLNPPSTPPVHQQLWTELQFDLSQAASPAADIGSFRFRSEVYSHGWHDIDPLTGLPLVPSGPPNGFDDSSEEWVIHDAEIQIFDQSTQAWVNVMPWFDPAAYTFDTLWRDQPYARSWSRPVGSGPLSYPGPLESNAVPWRPGYVDAQGIVRIRLWKDVQFDTFGNWDVIHAIDYAWLEVQPRGVTSFGTPCSPMAGHVPQAYAVGVPDVVLGNPSFRLGLTDGPPTFLAAMNLSLIRLSQPILLPGFPGCSLYVGAVPLDIIVPPAVGANGGTSAAYPIPSIPSARGFGFYGQWVFFDPSLRLGLSDALEIVLQ